MSGDVPSRQRRSTPLVQEEDRLAALQRLNVLDAAPEAELEEVVALVARVFDAPTALVSLVDADRQWFSARVGMDLTETPREVAFCDHTIRQGGVLVVEDPTADPRFRGNPLVLGEHHIRFYAGAPLVTSSGAAIGSLCVMDTRARTASAYQQAMLLTLADQVVHQLESRTGAQPVAAPAPPRLDRAVGDPQAHLHRLVTEGSTGYAEITTDGVIVTVNAAAARMIGYDPDELVGRSVHELTFPHHLLGTEAALTRLRSDAVSSYEATRVYRHRTGRAVPVQATMVFLPATPDSPARVAALLVDLSPRISADTARVSAELAHQRVLDAATDPYIHIDLLGVVLEWNAAAETVFGYTAAQALGQTLAELIVPPDQRTAHTEGLRRVLAGGPPTFLGRAVEVMAQHRDGHLVHVELTPWTVDGDEGHGGGFHAFCRDIGERVAARAALLEANELLRRGQQRLEAAFEASATADAVVDATGQFLRVNAQLVRFLGRPREELIGRSLTSVVYPPDLPTAATVLTQISGGLPDRLELRFTTAEGQVRWGLVSAAATDDAEPPRVVVRIEDLQASKDLEFALARLKNHDPVTGLPNRALFLERVHQALTDAQEGSPTAVLVLEVDGLRTLVDREGFAAGDSVLTQLAQRLTAQTPPGATLASLHPGVFAAVVPRGGRDATALAENFLATVGAPLELPGATLTLRVSIGISTDLTGTVSPLAATGRLVQDAENAARQGHAEGGNVVVFAAPEMRRAQQRQQELEAHIRHALDSQQVGMAYQPVFDLSTGVIVSAEALLRLTDPEGRPIPPLEVVGAAEASGQIIALGARVLQLGAAQAARWRHDHGILVPVAVNVSAVQLTRPTFTSDVLSALEMAGVPSHALTLELTESVLLDSGSAGMEQLLVLRDHGVHLAIDDFGTGYASLVYLRDLPATTVKIDRSFVDGIPDDGAAMAIVAGVIGLARSFGMACIAEGIETDTQRAYLSAHGVLGQGFLLARPTDGATVSRLIAQHGAQPAGAPRDTLSVAEARDAAGTRRDRAGSERDDAGDERDDVGDRRDLVGDQRDRLADRRDQAGDRRDQAADRRDDLADTRDRAGTRRDEAAKRRDHHDEQTQHEPTPDSATTVVRLTAARRAAASDRERAMYDREVGASERASARRDRITSMTDRGAGASERVQAELDRSTSSADREQGAGERARAEDDRSTSQADRGAAARDREHSTLDALTGAHTRGAGLVELAREIARAERTGQALVLAYVDVDKLKVVNDTAGHAAGDDLLRAVAHALTARLRSYDLIIRYGGDEFLCAVTGLSLRETEARLVEANAALSALTTPASFSAGLTTLDPGDTLDSFIARADAALYLERERGA
jgi:diguanylate cyclase (GGDEF)-like protein/PAS domain S-box-containing protein